MDNILRKALNSFLSRSADAAYASFPKRSVLKFYCFVTYALRTITWKLACRYYGPDIVRYRSGIDAFLLSQIRQGDSVLDIGCAEGYLTGIVARKARSVIGVDIDPSYLDKAPRDLENAKFIAGNILEMKFDELFDAAILIHSIEHMEDSEKVFRNLSRIARRMILETPSRESDWLSEILETFGIKEAGDDKHVKLYDRASLKAQLEASGWTDIVFYEAAGGALRLTANSRYLKEEAYARAER